MEITFHWGYTTIDDIVPEVQVDNIRNCDVGKFELYCIQKLELIRDCKNKCNMDKCN